jgi:uncharacterized protein
VSALRLPAWLYLAPIALIVLALAPSALAVEAPIPKPPARWVTDEVSMLSPQVRAELDRKLEVYERATGHQVVVWIGDSIGTTPLEDFAVRSFEAWKIGRKGKDDGVLLIVLKRDRKIAIEVGYGLVDKIPDAIASRIIRETITPRLQAGQADVAISSGVDAMLSAIEGKPFEPGARPAPQPSPPLSVGKVVVYGVLALLFLLLLVTHPELALMLLFTMGGGRGGGGGFEGGGGFGGGGGRSGGGGARGSW